MARFVDLDPSRPGGLPSTLEVSEGDLLRFHASGGKVLDGHAVVRVLGIYQSAVLTTAGTVLAPEGAPNALVVLAVSPGVATVETVTGEPFRSPEHARVRVEVRSRSRAH